MKNTIITEFRGKYESFSNFFEIDVEYDGITYRSSETAFQAQKTLDNMERQKIAYMKSGQAKRYCARNGPIILRSDWELVKEQKMREIVEAKFRQHPNIQVQLLDTGFTYLLEGNTWHDNEWGECFCPRHIGVQGENKLGLILMSLREKLRHEHHSLDIGYGRRLIVDTEHHHTHPNIEVQIGTFDGIEGIIAHIELSSSGTSVVSEVFDGRESGNPAAIVKYQFA